VQPIIDRPADQGREQVLDLAAGQRDHAWWWGMLVAFGKRATTTRKAWASMARVTHRYQERQRRTWCSSSLHSPLVAWKPSSMV
jgi:hypothetical protein